MDAAALIAAFPVELWTGYTVDMALVFHATLAALLVMAAALLVMFRRRKVPGRVQGAAEALVANLEMLLVSAAGPRAGRRWVPLVGSAMLFLFTFHVMGVLRLDMVPHSPFTTTGWAIGAEPLTVDLDGDGVFDPGDSFDDTNGNGHRDRGLLIPHPAVSAYSFRIDLAVGVLLGAAILVELLRRGRLLMFLFELLSLRALSRLGLLLGDACARLGLARATYLPVAIVGAAVLVLFHQNRAAAMHVGLDVPLALIDALLRSAALTTVVATLLGSATGQGLVGRARSRSEPAAVAGQAAGEGEDGR